MIEVRQRNQHGTIQFLGWFTEEQFVHDFGDKIIVPRFYSDISKPQFSDDLNNVSYRQDKPIWYKGYYYGCVVTTQFDKVAYNEKGKLIPFTELVGLVRRITNITRKYRYNGKKVDTSPKRLRGSKHRSYWNRSSFYRHIRTLQEKKWADAWNDEEFVPYVRPSRRTHNIPPVDYWGDDLPHRKTYRSWKHYRKHQWKDKR